MTIIPQGISWLAAGIIGAGSAAGLLALHFLKNRTPGQLTASVMLWQEAGVKPVRRVLREKLSRILSLLLLLTAVLALTGALTEPVLDLGKTDRKLVITAAPEGLGAAEKMLDRADPLRTALILADGGGSVLRNFKGRAMPLLQLEKPAAADTDAVLVLAERMAGRNGVVCWIGSEAPPWLPEGGRFVRTANRKRESVRPPLRVYLQSAPDAFRRAVKVIPGIRIVDDMKQADLVFHCRKKSGNGGESEEETEKFYDFLIQSGLYHESAIQEIADRRNLTELPPSRSYRLTGWLFLLALSAFLLDAMLWHKRKTI